MGKNKIKIVLDADVLIHFQKAGYLSLLPEILPEYECVVLSVVYGELSSIRSQLYQHVHLLKNISLESFAPSGDMAREYAILSRQFGRGESACMAYCRFNHDVLGSSNLKDISNYCQANGITYLTTLDFLYFAFIRRKLTKNECDAFIHDVNAKGSKLPNVDISTYVCKVII